MKLYEQYLGCQTIDYGVSKVIPMAGKGVTLYTLDLLEKYPVVSCFTEKDGITGVIFPDWSTKAAWAWKQAFDEHAYTLAKRCVKQHETL